MIKPDRDGEDDSKTSKTRQISYAGILLGVGWNMPVAFEQFGWNWSVDLQDQLYFTA